MAGAIHSRSVEAGTPTEQCYKLTAVYMHASQYTLAYNSSTTPGVCHSSTSVGRLPSKCHRQAKGSAKWKCKIYSRADL